MDKKPAIHFSIKIGNANGYGGYENLMLDFKVEGDLIPEGVNPFDYLRTRLREEIIRAEGKTKLTPAVEVL